MLKYRLTLELQVPPAPPDVITPPTQGKLQLAGHTHAGCSHGLPDIANALGRLLYLAAMSDFIDASKVPADALAAAFEAGFVGEGYDPGDYDDADDDDDDDGGEDDRPADPIVPSTTRDPSVN